MNKNLLSNSIFSILNNFIQLLVSLGSGFIIARNLGTDGKGEVYFITQIFSLLGVFFTFGFGPAILFFLKNNEISNARINFFILVYSILLIILFFLITLLFSSEILNLFNNNFQFKILFYTFLIAYLNIVTGLLSYKQMKNINGVKRWSIISLISNTFYLFFLAYFVVIENFQVLGVIYALIIGGLLKCVMLAYNSNYNSKPNFDIIQKDEIRKLSKFGFEIFLTNLFLTSVFRLDSFFLNKTVNFSELGLYSVAINVGELVLLIPSAVGIALFPRLIGISKEEQKNSMCLVGRLSFVIGIVSTVVIAVVGYPFILIVFGRNFLPAFIPFLFLLPGLLAMTLNYAYSNYFSSIGKPIINAYIFLVGLIINVLTNIWLIPNYGILGAAISSSISYFVITLCFIVKIKKTYKLSLLDFFFPNLSDIKHVKVQLFNYFNGK